MGELGTVAEEKNLATGELGTVNKDSKGKQAFELLVYEALSY
jgi:hypothetical protein